MLKEYAPNFAQDFTPENQPNSPEDGLDSPDIYSDGASLPLKLDLSRLALSELNVSKLEVSTDLIDSDAPEPLLATKTTECGECSAQGGVCAPNSIDDYKLAA